MAKYRKLGKASAQRNALLRNQVTQLLYHGKIKTTSDELLCDLNNFLRSRQQRQELRKLLRSQRSSSL